MKKSQSALWSANVDLKKNSQLKKFCDQLESKGFIKNKLDFKNLWKWSIKNNEKFWSEVWDFTKIKGNKKLSWEYVLNEFILENPGIFKILKNQKYKWVNINKEKDLLIARKFTKKNLFI